MNGAGALTAFDNRTSNSTATGHLGGLLQSATYLTGLSGGSWLVGSMYKSSFVPVPNIPSSLWQFDDSILAGI
jgi:lysophospholipase